MNYLSIRKLSHIVFLSCILGLAAFLRFSKLGQIPSGFYVDEAAIAYNSYSLLTTGRDEFGKSFPVFMRSYGAYSSPLYIYVSTIPIYFFGLSIFSARFLSALCGTISVLIFFLILTKFRLRHNILTFVGALLFAVTPWNIFFSRAAFEANFALLLLIVSVYFFVLTFNNLNFIIPASIFISLSTYAYQAERPIAYLLLGVYVLLFYRKQAKQLMDKKIFFSLGVFLLIQLPQLVLMNTKAFSLRAGGLFYKDAILSQGAKIPLTQLISVPLAFLREFLSQFFAYFSARNLFFLPDPDIQRSVPELSVFYSWMSVPFLVGLFVAVGKLKEQRIKFLFLMLIIFALPASLTKDPYSTLRSLPLVIPFSLIITLGIEKLIEFGPRYLWVLVGLLTLAISGVFLWRSYFVLFPKERSVVWNYGYQQLASEISSRDNEHFVIDQSRRVPSYILLAFYLKYPPLDLQKLVDPSIKNEYYNSPEFNSYYKFLNLETRNIHWEEDVYKEQILVGDEYSVSEEQAKEHFLTKIFEIRSPEPLSEIVFVGYKTNPALKCKSDYIPERCRNI